MMAEIIDRCGTLFPLTIPIIAVIGLWIARLANNDDMRSHAERLFFVAFVIVAGGTLRTMVADDPCWLIHTTSLGVMIVGAVIPATEAPIVEEIC
jgi:hypothetical protein